MIWYTRWHIARFMIHAGLRIAPDGPVKSLLIIHLEGFSRVVLDAISEADHDPN